MVVGTGYPVPYPVQGTLYAVPFTVVAVCPADQFIDVAVCPANQYPINPPNPPPRHGMSFSGCGSVPGMKYSV